MLLQTLSLLVFILKVSCICENSVFQNTRVAVLEKNAYVNKFVNVTGCIELTSETANWINIEIQDQSLSKLQKGTFKNLTVLTIALTNTSTSEIEKETFTRLYMLQRLDLSKNQIKQISKDIFNDIISLEVLTLSMNQIESIEEAAFANLVRLRELKLNNNKIKNYNPNWFANNHALNELNMENNLLEILTSSMFSNLPNLLTLVLRSNRLKDIDKNAFERLGRLSLLDLSENNLTKLHKDVFSPFGCRNCNLNFAFFGLLNLYIHRNNLTYLPDQVMNDLAKPGRKLNFITLYSNPWQCSCYRKIVKWVDQYRIHLDTWGKGCKHSKNPVCIMPEKNSDKCMEEVEEDIRSKFYSIYKHYEVYDGTDQEVHCVPI